MNIGYESRSWLERNSIPDKELDQHKGGVSSVVPKSGGGSVASSSVAAVVTSIGELVGMEVGHGEEVGQMAQFVNDNVSAGRPLAYHCRGCLLGCSDCRTGKNRH